MPVQGDAIMEEAGEQQARPKLYVLHDNDEWLRSWRPALDKVFGRDGYEEWLLDGDHQSSFPFDEPPPMGVFFCKGSGSSHMRGLPHTRDFFTAVLQWLECHGRVLVNGERAFAAETSKVGQLVAMSNFGLQFAKTTAVFGVDNLSKAAKAFMLSIGEGEGFWIRFNRAGCGRGICLCHSIADVDAFTRSGLRSADEIYILQKWVDVPAVVRLEFSFGKLLYGMEICNKHRNPAAMAPCGCIPQDLTGSCTSLLPAQDSLQKPVSIKTAVLASALTGALGVFCSWYVSRMPKAPRSDQFALGAGLVGLAGVSMYASSTRKLATPLLLQNPVRLLRLTELREKYPQVNAVARQVKLLMSDLGAGTMAIDVVQIGDQMTVLDMNIHTNYSSDREKEAGLPDDETGIGSVCQELSSLLRSIQNSSSQIDVSGLPGENLVFGIGLPRTATHSLAEALKISGYRGWHKGAFGKHPVQYQPKARKFAGNFDVDTSHYQRYQELFKSHPTARFIITTRLDDEWKESIESWTRNGKTTLPEDLPTPNQYLSEVLRFFVNHHATHRLMVCNLFSEEDELLWSKFMAFLSIERVFDSRVNPFPRVSMQNDGRLAKAAEIKKSPSMLLLAESFTADESTVAAGVAVPGATPRLTAARLRAQSGQSKAPSIGRGTAASDADSEYSQAQRTLNRYLDYSKSYLAKYVVRPDNPEASKLPLLKNMRLSPMDYDRNLFHLEMKVAGTPLESYDTGDCLAIYAQNSREQVADFIAKMEYDGTELLELDNFFTGTVDGTYVMALDQLCVEYVDLFGPPTRGFYLALSKHAKDIVEKQILAELSLPRKAAEFEARAALAETYASTILEFPSAGLMPLDLLDLVPLAKPRLYSIASSRHMHPGEVHLCLVTHDWTTSKGEERIGLSTGYLEKMDPEANEMTIVAALVRSEVLKLPKNPSTPVIMAGMGTGMAPFRAFIEDRAVMKQNGQHCGHMHLYFGARHEHGEFLYRTELENYVKEGLLTLRCAWSRDQAQKIYVQMLMAEDGERIWEALRPEAGGHFYICGPIAPLPDIKAALVKIFGKHGYGPEYLEQMEATGRFATEVY